jgi:DNA polymerase-3 subunit beta
MHCTIHRAGFDKALQHLNRVIVTRQTMPILSNVLLEVGVDFLELRGTDLDLTLYARIPAQVKERGTFTVPVRMMAEFVHQNPDDELQLSREGYELVVQSAHVSARFTGIEAEEYPELPELLGGTRLTVPTQEFVTALKQVVIACAHDTARPVLTGVLMQAEKEHLTLAATDSFRLAERTIAAQCTQEIAPVIIPSRTCQELLRLIGDGAEADLTLEVSEQAIVVRSGIVTLHSRVITGNYPKYQAIIPATTQVTAEIATSEFIQALRLIAVAGTSGIANVLIEITADGQVTLASHGGRTASVANTVHALVSGDTQALRTAFSVRYLLDAANATGASSISLAFSGAMTALVLRTSEPDYLQLVMPIRLDVV